MGTCAEAVCMLHEILSAHVDLWKQLITYENNLILKRSGITIHGRGLDG